MNIVGFLVVVAARRDGCVIETVPQRRQFGVGAVIAAESRVGLQMLRQSGR